MPAARSGPVDVDGASSSTSASAIVAATITGHHVLHIEGYSRTKEELPNGACIECRPFMVGGRSWRLSYYPNGVRLYYTDSISIFLSLLESSTSTGPVTAEATFSLLDRAGKPVLSQVTPANEYQVLGHGYGFYDFVERGFLEASDLLKDDCFRIRCDISFPEVISTEDRAAAALPAALVDEPSSDMHRHFGDLLASGDGADVTFHVAGETIRAHRYILGARSPVFRAELMGSLRETTAAAAGDCVQVDGMLHQVFKALLHFVYTDSLPEMEEHEEAVMAQHLLEAGDRYGMQRLKLICEDKLCKSLEVSTAATTLVVAEQHNCQGLKEACVEFMISPDALEAVMETDGFEHLTKSCPALVKELMSKLGTRLYKRRKLKAR